MDALEGQLEEAAVAKMIQHADAWDKSAFRCTLAPGRTRTALADTGPPPQSPPPPLALACQIFKRIMLGEMGNGSGKSKPAALDALQAKASSTA